MIGHDPIQLLYIKHQQFGFSAFEINKVTRSTRFLVVAPTALMNGKN